MAYGRGKIFRCHGGGCPARNEYAVGPVVAKAVMPEGLKLGRRVHSYRWRVSWNLETFGKENDLQLASSTMNLFHRGPYVSPAISWSDLYHRWDISRQAMSSKFTSWSGYQPQHRIFITTLKRDFSSDWGHSIQAFEAGDVSKVFQLL